MILLWEKSICKAEGKQPVQWQMYQYQNTCARGNFSHLFKNTTRCQGGWNILVPVFKHIAVVGIIWICIKDFLSITTSQPNLRHKESFLTMAIPLKGFFTWWWSGQNGSNRAPIPNHLKWSCWLLYWWHWHWHWHRCHFVATNNEQEWMIASVLLSEPTGCIWCVRLMGGGTDVGAPSPIHRAPVLHASPHKCYTSTNTQAQTLNASTQVQIHKHKYTNTNTQA